MPSRPPLISIIVPTKNAATFLPPTLESLRAQPERDWECIFVDGQSVDGTIEMIQKFRHQAKIPTQLVQDSANGVAEAFNKGMTKASGKYFYFLCAGDRLRSQILDLVTEDLAKSPDVLYGKVYECSFDKISGGTNISAVSLALFNICHQGVFVSAEIFRRVGVFNPKYPAFSDYEFNLRCFGTKGIRVCVTDRIIADYLGGGPSENGDEVFERDREQLVRRHLGEEALTALKTHRSKQDEILLALNQGLRQVWAIYGAGAYGLSLRHRVQNLPCGESLQCFIDSNPKKWGGTLGGYPIIAPHSDQLLPGTKVVVAVGNISAQQEIKALLVRNGQAPNDIYFW